MKAFLIPVVLLLVVLGIASTVEQPQMITQETPLAPIGYVVDTSDVLTPDAESLLTNQLKQLDEATGIQIAVVTLPTTNGEPLADYSVRLAHSWGVGNAEQDSGIMFITAVEDRDLRIDVGYGLEGALTDSQTGKILDTAVVPRYKEGNYEAGIVEGVNALIHHLTNTQNGN